MTVFTGASRLLLPERPAAAEDGDVVFPAPESAPPLDAARPGPTAPPTTSSTMLFQAPHAGQRPAHCGVLLPHSWQT